VYRLFTDSLIWPRGFPLALVNDPDTFRLDVTDTTVTADAPIQQGLAHGAPDVDAVWRMMFDRRFFFRQRPSVQLLPGTWCPFNSQSTWWWPPAYPLLYLPSYCSFRMTDIWRSFVAQRCLWELGSGVVFHPPEVVQHRNQHCLRLDFADEIDGYIRNEELVRELRDLVLRPGVAAVGENLLRCYRRLVECDHLPPTELELVEAWLADVDTAIVSQSSHTPNAA
jgi:hypothetical protein